MFNNNNRSRSFCLTTYISIKQLSLVLESHSNIQYFAYITHDKDLYDGSDNVHTKGQCVPKHIHIVLRLFNATTPTAVLNWFKGGIDWENTFIEETFSEEGIFNYLTHENCYSEFKYHYDKNLIVSNDISYFNNLVLRGSSSNVISIIDDIIKGVPFRELAIRYGRDLVLNYSKYYDFAFKVRAEENHVSYSVCDLTDILVDGGKISPIDD